MSEVDETWGEDILRMLDERLARLEKEARAGSDFAAEARDELRATRLAWGKQIDLTRDVIVHNAKAFHRAEESHAMQLKAQRAHIDRSEERHREVMEEIRAHTRAIWKIIDRMDRLDGGPSPA